MDVGTAVVSALSATGATALTMLVGWWQLRKTEAYRRASRWEPMAERLWQERFNVYERMLSAFDANAEAIRRASLEDFDKSNRAIIAAHSRLQAFGGSRVIALSVIVMRVNHELLNIAEDHGFGAFARANYDALTQAIGDMVLAMRIDLGIQVLDSHSDEWFQRTKGEALHEEWRKIFWKSMGRIERNPPPNA